MKISSKEEFEKLNVFGTGTANTAYAKYFIGDSFLNPLTKAKDGLFLANVTFERDAAITGISTTLKKAAVSSLSVPQARAGIRNTARPQ